MTLKRKIFSTLIFVIIPILLLADEHEPLKQGRTFFDFVFTLKYLFLTIVTIAGLAVIWRGKMNFKTRIILMSVSFLLFGVISAFASYLFVSPSPVCATTKPFLYGLKPQFLATLSVIGILSIAGSKSFCGSACPVGAIQELLYRIPIFKEAKKKKVPFKISNTLRILIFLSFAVIALTLGTSVYYYINLFDLIHWEFQMPITELAGFIIFLAVILGASFILFRPFCYFICPMGLLTWILEQFSLTKVRLKKDKCDNCGVCETVSPCTAITDILKGKRVKADCHICGDCLRSCDKEALYYGFKKH